MRIVVAGMAAQFPLGGVAFDYLQYVIGFARLGHDVYYYEDTWSWPYDPEVNARTSDPAYSIRFLRDFFAEYAPDLAGRWRYVHLHEVGYGIPDRAWKAVARTTDLFLNLSGASLIPDELASGCVTAFIDTDPGYNQIVMLERPSWSPQVDRWTDGVTSHDVHFTYAENIHGPDCRVPHAGLHWIPTRMPIIPDIWDVGDVPTAAPWTTVMTWNAFAGPLVFDGIDYGSKDREFDRIIGLPGRTGLPLVIALGGRQAPVARLKAHGWAILDGPSVSLRPSGYRAFIRDSTGELSVAKHVYVALRTGWFSCRSACYLAAGRPVVVQDTGFRGILPTGDGLLAFDDMEEAAEGMARVRADAVHHQRAATRLAHEEFAFDRVLPALLAAI